MNGGMLRCFHLLRQLCRNFNVTAIIHQDADDFYQGASQFPELKQCKIFSTKNHVPARDVFSLFPKVIANALRFRYWKRSLKGPADGNFLRYYPLLVTLLKKDSYDCVIFENLTTLHCAPVVRRFGTKFILYDAHNVDSLLSEKSVTRDSYSETDYRMTINMESSLYKLADGVMTCSRQDLDTLKKMNKGQFQGVVIPNGVVINDSNKRRISDQKDNRLIFCGSLDYEPNREGLLWFCTKVFPGLRAQIPFLQLMVVGKGDPGTTVQNVLTAEGIIFYGKVDDLAEYYSQASLAIVPLLTGSGTRLKVLEAMGMGVPVVSTSKGAEGIDYTPGENICIADGETQYRQMIINVLNNKAEAASIASKAYCLVKQNYDWNIIGDRLTNFLKENLTGN